MLHGHITELVWFVKARATVEVVAVISTQSASHTVSVECWWQGEGRPKEYTVDCHWCLYRFLSSETLYVTWNDLS